MDRSLPGSSVHWILQARILEWVAMPSSRGSPWPRDPTWVSYIAANSLLLSQSLQKSQLIEIIPLIWMSATRGQYLWLLILSLLRLHCLGGGCSHWLLDSGYPVSIPGSLRACSQGSCNMVAWWLQHPLLTDMAGNIFFFIDTAKVFLPLHPHTTYHPEGEGDKRRDMAGAAEATPILHQEWLLRIIWPEP